MLIIHGENLVVSRKKLSEYKLRFKGEVVEFEGTDLNLTQLKQAVESPSLFGQEKLIIVRNLLNTSVGAERQKVIGYLKQNFLKNLIIWEGKKVDGRTLSGIKAQILRFDLTPLIFRFLDSLSPANKKISLLLLHQCLERESPEMISYMISRQIKSLIIAVDLGEEGLLGFPQWKVGKLINQARAIGSEKLFQIYRRLLKIEWEQKTGTAPKDLAFYLDLLIASL